MALTATDISVHFAGVSAIDHVSMALHPGEILGLIGPNGAGKTTLVNVLSGFQVPAEGKVHLDDTHLLRATPGRFTRQGIVRTFQAVRLFKGMSVSENVEVGLASLGIGRSVARHRAAEILDYVGLAEKIHWSGGALNYGDERRVGIARALALNPKYLLLDEPAAGMNIAEAEALGALIQNISRDFSCSVLLIEHNMRLVMSICARLHVLSSGRTIAEGTPAEVADNKAFKAAYLGSEVLA